MTNPSAILVRSDLYQVSELSNFKDQMTTSHVLEVVSQRFEPLADLMCERDNAMWHSMSAYQQVTWLNTVADPSDMIINMDAIASHIMHNRQAMLEASFNSEVSFEEAYKRPISNWIDLPISRLFVEGDQQTYGSGMVIRPEFYLRHPDATISQIFHSISEHVKHHPNVLLVDDDSQTGRIFEDVKAKIKFKADANIRQCCLTQPHMEMIDSIDYMVVDVVDVRDFIFGVPFGGLVVGHDRRAPYFHPFVNLTTRTRIAPSLVDQANQLIIDLNRAYYEPVKDASASLLAEPFKNWIRDKITNIDDLTISEMIDLIEAGWLNRQ